ncbi:hypothetical protein BG004_000967 [Podila humilis]|nr:hypothetical protein BG004_000967 [Podila humilis]
MTVPATTSSQQGSSPAQGSNTTTSTANGHHQHQDTTNSRPASTIEGDDHHPELDDFVKGFCDGGGFSDVDNRVWVTST